MSDHPLCIAYFDLGFSREQYGLQPTRYGGGGVAARYLKEDPEIEFHVFAPAEAFENVGIGERRDQCHALDAQAVQWLRMGGPLDAPTLMQMGFDLILHGHTCHTLNRGSYPGPIVHFCGFDGSAGHPGNDYVLLYDPSFTPRFGERAKYVRIGKPVPAQCPPRPSPFSAEPSFVFQCSRHDDHMNSIETARQAKAAGIPVVFAGPIHNGYPLLDHCDGTLIRYVGEIGEEEKLDYCRRAVLFALPHAWPTMPFNQSVIEAQGQGTPVWATRAGPFLTRYLRPGINGFDSTTTSLVEAVNGAHCLLATDCWAAAREYDTSVMVASFKRAFREIVDEWHDGTRRECI